VWDLHLDEPVAPGILANIDQLRERSRHYLDAALA
jgi:hypothetical protein